MSDYIHGPTDPDEVARLEHQAVFIGSRALLGFVPREGDLVLDLGTGVGAMVGQLLHHYPGIRVVGIDRQRSALRNGPRQSPRGDLCRGRRHGFAIPGRRVRSRPWLLDHRARSRPGRRPARGTASAPPSGTCRFLEVDNASLRTVPEYAEVVIVMAALNQTQIAANAGDPFIGQRLNGLLVTADFSRRRSAP